MAKTDRAQKAAETRAKNAELAAQKEAEQLANETKGELNCLELEISNNSLNDAWITEGRGAKKKALKMRVCCSDVASNGCCYANIVCLVWKTNPNKGQHRDASGDDLQQKEQRREYLRIEW